MFGQEFSTVLAIILGALTVAFFMGKGSGIMDLFQGRNAPPRKKRSPEDELKYQRAIGVFCLILTISEVINALVGYAYPFFGIITIIIVVADMVFIVMYIRKNFPE